MPSEIIIKIECPAILIRFMEKLYGKMPIDFPRNDDLLRTLNHLLNRPPKLYKEDSSNEGKLLIRVPYFEDKNVLYNFYISEFSKKIFINRLTRYFKLVFRDDINKSRLEGLNCKDSINLFMDKYEFGDDQDFYDFLQKDYDRYFQVKYQVRHLRKKRKKISSVRSMLL